MPIPAVSASESDSRVDAATGKRVASGGSIGVEEHTLVIRVYDRFENMGISKVVVKGAAGR